jgi:hypothetical protein
MSGAPERIWVAPWREGDWREGDWREGDWDDNEGKTLNDKPCIQYVRADRIEALTEKLNEANQVIDKQGALLADAYGAYLDWDEVLKDRADHECKAKLAKAMEALRKLHHTVCGETGFAACVRLDSGLAYPWPALDEADEMTRAVLAEIEGGKT